MIKKYSLKALQKAINHALSLDPSLAEKTEPLRARWVCLVIEPLGVDIFLGFSSCGLLLRDKIDQEPDTVIHSSPLGLIRLSLLPASRARSLFNDRIRMSGDVELGQQVKSLFDSLDIDWEGHLARFTGDILAHQAGNFFRQGRDLGRKMIENFRANFGEALQEEWRMFPPREEVEDFFADIDSLVMEVDRLQARFTHVLECHESH